MFDQQLSMKVVLLVTGAFAIGAWLLFRGRGDSLKDLGTVRMSDQRRVREQELEEARWK